jgi:hypothetical protein
MATLHKDLHLTAEFLAFLRAGLFSQVMLENAESRLGAAFLPPSYIEIPHKGLEKVDTWIKELEEGLPLFATSWTSPETFDAISAMGFLKELKRDVLWFAQVVDNALIVPDLVDDRATVKLLSAAVHRSATTRLAYLETLNSLFTNLKAPDRAQTAAAEIPQAFSFVQTANTILDIFGVDTPYDNALCEKLRGEASLVPSDMRAHAHDARIFLNVYAKQFDYELAEIPTQEARPWLDMKIPAVAAGYWHAYRFSPEDYARWASVGIRGAPLAAYWRRARFHPEDAMDWIQKGIPPMVAMEWARAGFDAGRAVAMMQRGIVDPTRAPRNRDGEP